MSYYRDGKQRDREDAKSTQADHLLQFRSVYNYLLSKDGSNSVKPWDRGVLPDTFEWLPRPSDRGVAAPTTHQLTLYKALNEHHQSTKYYYVPAGGFDPAESVRRKSYRFLYYSPKGEMRDKRGWRIVFCYAATTIADPRVTTVPIKQEIQEGFENKVMFLPVGSIYDGNGTTYQGFLSPRETEMEPGWMNKYKKFKVGVAKAEFDYSKIWPKK